MSFIGPLLQLFGIGAPPSAPPASGGNAATDSAIKQLAGAIANLQKEIDGLQKEVTNIVKHGGGGNGGGGGHGGCGGSHGGRSHSDFGRSSSQNNDFNGWSAQGANYASFGGGNNARFSDMNEEN